MLNFYTVIVSGVVLLMALLAFMANANDLLSQIKKRQFLLLFASVVLGIVAEWSGSVAGLFGGEYREVVVWTKTVELSVTPFAPFICAEILRPPADEPSRSWWFPCVLALHTALEVLSAFNGLIYYVDADGVFCHGPLYGIYLATYLGGAAYVLWMGHRVSRQYQGKNKAMLALMVGFLLLGIAANQADKSVKSAWLTVAIVVVLLYIFYNDMLQRVDGKTMLLNRASCKNLLARLRRPAIVQLLDVDSFKAVNEEHGRDFGDECLRTVGEAVRKVYGRYGACCRIEGDEFCVVLDVEEGFLEELNDRFGAAMEERRAADPRLPRVSWGHARFDPSCGSARDAVQAAAFAMRRNKERNKIKHGPLAHPAPEKRPTPLAPEPEAAGGGSTSPQSLDTSGLTDRTFAAFSSTSERSYLYLANMGTGVSRWSPAAVRYFDLPSEYMFEARHIWESRIHPEDRQMYHDDIEAVFTGRKQVHELEYRVKNRLGEYVVCTCRGMVLKGSGTEPDFFAGAIVNHGIVDEVDPITGLHATAAFAKSIHRLIEERTHACVIKVGIENFRHVNAMYGQEGGNQILRLFGIELRDLVAGKGQAFRLDGAKFAFYLYDVSQDEARKLFGRLRRVADDDIQIDGLRIPLRIYGGAVWLDPRCPRNEHVVLSGLVYAMEQSLENYRNELVFSEDVRQMVNVENIQLHAEIHRSAMEGCRGFFLCYQPIVSFATGKVIGAEALLRWKQEPYGVVPPNSFIPWLENDPAFIPVGNWILRQAIRETAPLRQANPGFVLNVNVADTQLKYGSFREDVLDALADEGCPPECLCLELTERCRRLDPDFLEDELRFFRSRGVVIALDDFGTGTSSLSLLLQLPVDELKVDRVFLLGALESRKSLSLMETIIQSARKAGLRTCVEGIETEGQRELIASLGGDCYQGYYASKPTPIEGLLKLCRASWQAGDGEREPRRS